MLTWEQVTVDAAEPRALAHWWAEVLGWVVTLDEDDEQEIRPTPDTVPGVMFVRVEGAKAGKNRLHLDLRPDDHDAELARVLALGARRTDIAQGDVPWAVLADPEGNEFCILGSPHPA
ncbi:MAG: VOC family protein [Candidatus Nanopelagicales bacterium]